MIRALILVIGAVCCAAAQEATEAAAAPEIPRLLDLRTAQDIALRDNPSIHAALARIDQAAARIKQARSQYFPTLGATASAAFTDLADNTVNLLPPGSDDSVEQYNARLDATWLIFDGFAREFRNKAAKFDESSNEAAYRNVQRQLLSAVANAFYNVQLARENIAIAEADGEFNERQLVEAQARKRVGTGSLSDVLNFEVRVREAQTRLLQGQGGHRVALIVLGELMGVPEAAMPADVDVAPLTPETPEELVEPSVMDSVAFALANRPDVEQSELLVQQAKAFVRINQSSYYPSLAAIASHEGDRTSDASLEEDDFASTVGLVLSIDVFTGGLRRARVQESRAFKSETERLYDQTALGVASEVRQVVQNLSTAQQQLRLQRETTQYVEQNRDLVEKEYDSGQGSLVRLNEAQRDLISARSRLALAQVAMRLLWHDLRTATGEVLEPYAAE